MSLTAFDQDPAQIMVRGLQRGLFKLLANLRNEPLGTGQQGAATTHARRCRPRVLYRRSLHACQRHRFWADIASEKYFGIEVLHWSGRATDPLLPWVGGADEM